MTIRLADDFENVPTNVNEWNSLAEILGVDFDHVDDLSVSAWKLYSDRRFRESASVFHALIVLDPENIELYRGFAMASSKDNDLAGAIDALEKALFLLERRENRDPDRSQLLAILAGFLYRAGRKVQSVECAERALSLSPKDASWRPKLESGLERARAKIAKQKERWHGLDVQALIEPRLKSLKERGETLAWALGYEDKALLTLFQNGVRLLDSGHPKRALRIFEGLVRLDPNVSVFHSGLSVAFRKTGQTQRAKEHLNLAVRTARNVEHGEDLLADALLRRALYRFSRNQRGRGTRDIEELLALPAHTVPKEIARRAQGLLEGRGGTAEIPAATRVRNDSSSRSHSKRSSTTRTKRGTP